MTQVPTVREGLTLRRWALISGSGKVERTCLAYTREDAIWWFVGWRKGRGILTPKIPATWKVKDKGIAPDAAQQRARALTIWELQEERDTIQRELKATGEALKAEREAHESTKARLAFGAQEVDRLRAEVEHHKGVAAANAHRERWEQRRAGRAEEKLRDLEALVRAERIMQRSGTTSLVGAADFILGVSDPSTQAVSTTSPINARTTAQERL